MKFKVWCKNNNEWEKHDVLLNQAGDLFHIKLGGALLPLKPDTHIPVFFTGLKDKNGKEIYEGDIVAWRNKNFKVVYKQDRHYIGWVATQTTDENCYIHIWYSGIKIIGNCWDNPDLLEQSSC